MDIKSSSQGLKIKEAILDAFKDKIIDLSYQTKGNVNRIESEREKQIRSIYQFLRKNYPFVVRGIEVNQYIDDDYSKYRHLTIRSKKEELEIQMLEGVLNEFFKSGFSCGLQFSFAVKKGADVKVFLFMSRIYHYLSFEGLNEAKETLAKLKDYIDNFEDIEVYFINDMSYEESSIKGIEIIIIKREYVSLGKSSDKGRANTIVKSIDGTEKLLEDEATKYFENQNFEVIHIDDYRGEYRFLFSKEGPKEKKDVPKEILAKLKENDIKFEMGVPDLLVWDPENTSIFFFCEVKSQNDSLSHFQQDWINAYKNKVKTKILKIENV